MGKFCCSKFADDLRRRAILRPGFGSLALRAYLFEKDLALILCWRGLFLGWPPRLLSLSDPLAFIDFL